MPNMFKIVSKNENIVKSDLKMRFNTDFNRNLQNYFNFFAASYVVGGAHVRNVRTYVRAVGPQKP